MIHKYGWRGTKLRDNKIPHTYFITTWENHLSRRIAESANVHGLTFLSIVRGMQIFPTKSRLATAVKCESAQSLMVDNFHPHGIARGYSRSRRRAVRRNGRTDGRAVPYRETFDRVLIPDIVQCSIGAAWQHAENRGSSVFLSVSVIGIWLSPLNDNPYQLTWCDSRYLYFATARAETRGGRNKPACTERKICDYH